MHTGVKHLSFFRIKLLWAYVKAFVGQKGRIEGRSRKLLHLFCGWYYFENNMSTISLK
jgi:hypothetical protein